MNAKKLAFAAIAIVATLGAGLAEARGRDDVQWSVTIGHPGPVFAPPVYVYERPHQARHGHWQHSQRGFRDADRDGIPNRYDRVYNPRWDRDGDGIPNRYDRVHSPRWDRDGDGIPNRHDRVHSPRWDRDGDGIPNRHDRHDKRHHHGRGH